MAKHCLTLGDLDRERIADIDRELGVKLDGSQLAANTTSRIRIVARASVQSAIDAGAVAADVWPQRPRSTRSQHRTLREDRVRDNDTNHTPPPPPNRELGAMTDHDPTGHIDDLLTAAYALDGPDANRALYARWADTYESGFIAHSKYVYREEVVRVFADYGRDQVGQTEAIADIGCGTRLAGAALRRLRAVNWWYSSIQTGDGPRTASDGDASTRDRTATSSGSVISTSYRRASSPSTVDLPTERAPCSTPTGACVSRSSTIERIRRSISETVTPPA
jgi:hypothetical protein